LTGASTNATLGASGIARLIGSGPLESGHAVLRHSGGVTYKTVWNIAKAAGIELTAGYAARGRPRLPEAKRAQILTALMSNPSPSWAARETGVSRSTVRGIARAEQFPLGGAALR
jgi:hypothetical protein